MLEVSGLSVSYAGMRVLDEVTLRVGEGELVALLGRNGAGKTTTMRAITGLAPCSGSVRLDGISITGLAPHRIVSFGVSFAQEGKQIFTEMSVADNLTLGAYTRRSMSKQIDADRRRVFTLFPILEEKYNAQAGTLSGGEQQMLVVAQAMMAHPQLMLIDEPSQGLAPALVDGLFAALAALREEGTAVLLAEQIVDKVLPICDRLYVLNLGRVAIEGTPAHVAGSQALRDVYIGGADD
jgi:branched-chain amino acid transport system ATP-binding protein